MSVPPDQMQQPGAPPGGAPPGGAPSGPQAGGSAPPSPAAAPTSTPQQPKGEQAKADSQVMVALRILEHALVAHGSHTPKGGAIQKAIAMLTKQFGQSEDQAQEIMPNELKTALMDNQSAPGAGSGPQSLAGGAADGGAGGAQPPQPQAA